jgi:arsenate reductase (glutaredoxin)
MPTDVTIYHNPACGTSRNTLAMIRAAGIEPQIIDYVQHPPSRAVLADLIDRAGLTPRQAMRNKGELYEKLGLADPGLSDDALLDAMIAHPILIERPLVVSPLGVKLCRPSEQVLDLLPVGPHDAFTKEDGEVVPASRGD